MANTLEFLNLVVRRLKAAGIPVIIFGGWAEELVEAIAPRPHKDVDLLYIAHNFDAVDEFLKSGAGVEEILPKRFPHKRAFLYGSVMVELILLQPDGTRLITKFWNEYELQWPRFEPVIAKNQLRVAPPSVLSFYRGQYQNIERVRQRYIQ